MDNVAYERYQKTRLDEYELLCLRCGECCGVGSDACENLESGGGGGYRCRIYNDRLGPQKTVSGNIFNCVAIKNNIRDGFSNPGCAYVGL